VFQTEFVEKIKMYISCSMTFFKNHAIVS